LFSEITQASAFGRFSETFESLESLADNLNKPVPTKKLAAEAIDKITRNVLDNFAFDYHNNIVSYVGELILIDNNFCAVGLQMFRILIETIKKRKLNPNSMELLALKLPFIPYSNVKMAFLIRDILSVFDDSSIKLIDLASHGKTHEFEPFSRKSGSVREAWAFFGKDLGLVASSKLFGSMEFQSK
jgi:hypothetical protein